MKKMIQRAMRKAASKFTADTDFLQISDLHIQVKQEGGELLIFNDNDEELTRCVIEEWIGNTDESFYSDIVPILKEALTEIRSEIEHIPLLHPFSIVLVDEDKETIDELMLIDEDTIIVEGDLMQGLEEDLDKFWENLNV